MDNLGVQNPLGVKTSMTWVVKARVVLGGIDTVMDLTSKFLPFMRDPADWWDEQSGRKTETDPLKKAERDASASCSLSLLGGGVIGGLY